uniref:C-type lectin domain-containing protein n=1 Tax=Panagrolaimus sp. ES5 TaxID=591445 RepID=A0AC34G7D0_9BILA
MKLIFVFVVAIILFAVGECLDEDKCWTCQPAECMNKNDEPDWVEFGNNLYALLEEQVFQEEGEKRCVELGGHLASIHSKEENDFVHKLRGNNSVWIGQNKIANPGVDGTYTWTDGSPVDDFTVPWNQRQPKEKYTNCVFMANNVDSNGEWNDYFCDQNLPIAYSPSPPFAICKKPK